METLAKMVAVLIRRFHPRGTHRFLKLIFNPKKLQFRTVIPYDNNLKINIDTSYIIERELFFMGHYYGWVTGQIKKIVKSGDVVFDIGANIGSRTLILAKLVDSSGKVFAFEPHPDVFQRLNNNLRLNNFSNTKTFQIALSDKKGEAKLFSYHTDDNRNASLHSLNDLDKNTSFNISVSTIDNVAEEANLSRLDFIKVNARGSDFLVIKGGKSSILKFRPTIIFEYNGETWNHTGSSWQDALDFFTENNYSIYIIGQHRLISLNKTPPSFNTSSDILATPNL